MQNRIYEPCSLSFFAITMLLLVANDNEPAQAYELWAIERDILRAQLKPIRRARRYSMIPVEVRWLAASPRGYTSGKRSHSFSFVCIRGVVRGNQMANITSDLRTRLPANIGFCSSARSGPRDTFEKAAELHDSAQGHVYHILRTLRLNLAQPSHLISHYRSFISLHLSAIIPRLHTPDMPKANKAVKEEDSKPYIQPEGKKAQKSPQKNSEGPWTPDQAWLLFNALYKKGKPNRLAPFSARQTLPAIRIVKLTAVRFCYADKVDWKMVSEAVGRSSKVSWGSIRRKLSEQ
jgi:hypothetical protein